MGRTEIQLKLASAKTVFASWNSEAQGKAGLRDFIKGRSPLRGEQPTFLFSSLSLYLFHFLVRAFMELEVAEGEGEGHSFILVQ